MSRPEPFVREAGAGPGVVCIHANASSSSQWRGLMDQLAATHRVLAPDSYGAGKSPQWPSDRIITLRDEAELLEPVFERAGSPLILVGHSYGAAVALIAALRRPQRVRALALYEPTLFALVDAESPPPNAADGIRQAVANAAAALDVGDERRRQSPATRAPGPVGREGAGLEECAPGRARLGIDRVLAAVRHAVLRVLRRVSGAVRCRVEIRRRAPRVAQNPKTLERVPVPASGM